MSQLIISGVRQISLSSLRERARRAAAGFRDIGISRGDVVVQFLRNDFAFFEVGMAAALIGAYATPANWHSTEAETRYILEDSGARAIVIHADLLRRVGNAIPRNVAVFVVETPPEIGEAYAVESRLWAVPDGHVHWDSWLNGFEPLLGDGQPSPGAMVYTSGTTGRPKGVRRFPPTPEQFAMSMRLVSRSFGFEGFDPTKIVTVITGPMYHSAPNAFGMFAIRQGATTILQPRFDPEGMLRLIEQHRVTHLHMVPIMFVRLLALSDSVKRKYDLSSLQFIAHGAAPCPAPVKRAMIEWWGPLINEYYGSTEMGMVACCSSEQWLSHPGSVGKIIAEADVKIVDAEGNTLPTRAVGEVIARQRGTADFTYHHDTSKRHDTEKNGLIAPGDVGYIDEDGFLYLCDRAKDMIISGGVNIYPAEIEAELMKMPGVADCAVFGIPDEEYGEAVHAVVQASSLAELTQNDVRSFLRKQIAGFKVPKTVEFLAELPREDSGKIFKRKLREPFWQGMDRKI